MTTNSYALYSEVGRFPLYIERHVRIAQYFLKLFHIKSGNCILNTLLKCQYNPVNSNEQHTNWAKQVRCTLNNSVNMTIILFIFTFSHCTFFIFFKFHIISFVHAMYICFVCNDELYIYA